MCNPNLISGLQFGATGLEAGQTLQNMRFQAALSRTNATLAEREARAAREAGAAQATSILDAGRRLQGEQRAALAASGVDPSRGTALDLLSDTAYVSQLDARTALDNSGRQAEALEVEARSHRAQAKNLKRATPVAVGSTLLTRGTRAYGIYRSLTE